MSATRLWVTKIESSEYTTITGKRNWITTARVERCTRRQEYFKARDWWWYLTSPELPSPECSHQLTLPLPSPKRPLLSLYRNSKYPARPFAALFMAVVCSSPRLVAKINVVESAVKKWPRDTASVLTRKNGNEKNFDPRAWHLKSHDIRDGEVDEFLSLARAQEKGTGMEYKWSNNSPRLQFALPTKK